MNIILKTTVILLIVIIILRIIIYLISLENVITIAVNLFNMKINVKNSKYLKNFNKENYIIMANHYNASDYVAIIHAIKTIINTDKQIFAVAKYNAFNDKTDDNIISDIFGLFNNKMFNFFNLISYIRNNRESGEKVKQNILKIIKNNHILIFPDGEAIKTGKPTSFKSGSFRLCADNNIPILPITLIYKQNIGVARNEKIELSKLFNLDVDIIIHKPVKSNNWNYLKNYVFNKINEPFTLLTLQ